MSTFNAVDPQTATAEAKAALDLVQSAFGGIPNLMKMVAISPNVLTLDVQVFQSRSPKPLFLVDR